MKLTLALNCSASLLVIVKTVFIQGQLVQLDQKLERRTFIKTITNSVCVDRAAVLLTPMYGCSCYVIPVHLSM